MSTPFDFDHLRDLTVGTVDFVSPSEIKVLLDTNAPQNTALNTGVPSLFPRINGFVLIPNEIGALVGLINWIAVEHSQYPKRKGFKDYDLIDLPFPTRKMSINPIGTLKQIGKIEEKRYQLERGVYSFPSIGDNVILPTEYQLKAIVENKDRNAFVTIGKASIAGNANVNVDPDKLFGRHLAILGNTGSGKSCSVAGLIRWSLEAAKQQSNANNKALNARFIILDPNGEYSSAFDGIDKPVRKYQIKLDAEAVEGAKQLQVPAWLWNSHEWISFSQAAPGAQRPLLLQSLADLKRGRQLASSNAIRVKSFLTTVETQLTNVLGNLPNSSAVAQFIALCNTLENLRTDCNLYMTMIASESRIIEASINAILVRTNEILTARQWTTGRYNSFSHTEVDSILELVKRAGALLGTMQGEANEVGADTPLPFDIDELVPYLEQLAQNNSNNLLQFIQMLSLRMTFLFSDERLNGIVKPEGGISLAQWLDEYVGRDQASNGQIAVVDLSLVPSEVIHIIVAVLSRVIFEAVQRYRKSNQLELPTVMVLEEAHTFIRDRSFDETNTSQICREIFEKISREGRKFGLSIVLSSQRPSELSSTVLSQCNTFLLHRIVNDKDQDLVRKLVPDNIGGLLKELPILPTRKAILLGWASPIPMLVELRELKKEHCPQSHDPNFWDVWVGSEGYERTIDWTGIAREWQGMPAAPPPIVIEQQQAMDTK